MLLDETDIDRTKPVAWLVLRVKADQSIEQEIVSSPLTDDTYMEDGDEAYPLYIDSKTLSLENDEVNAELLGALEKAYLTLLQMPHHRLRASSQHTFCIVRDAIANTLNVDSETIQVDFEQAAIKKATE